MSILDAPIARLDGTPTTLGEITAGRPALLVNVASKTCAELCGPLRCDQAAPPLFLWTLRGLYLWGGADECLMRLPALLASVLALLAVVGATKMGSLRCKCSAATPPSEAVPFPARSEASGMRPYSSKGYGKQPQTSVRMTLPSGDESPA